MIHKKTRQIAIITIVLITSFTAVSLLNYKSATYSLRDELVNSSLPLLRENIYSEIEKDLLNPLNIAGAMANDSFLKAWVKSEEQNLEEITLYLKTIHEKYGFFSTFFVSQRTQYYYHHKGLLKSIDSKDPHDIWYYDFINSGKEYDLDVDTDQASQNSLTLFINYRVEDEQGNLLGVTGLGIEMQIFSQFLLDSQEKYKRKIYLVDESGYVQAHPEKGLIEKLNINDDPTISRISEELLLKKSGAIDLQIKNGLDRILITARYIPEINWFLVVEQNETEANVTARSNLIRTLLAGLLTSIIVSVICSIIINHYQTSLIIQATKDPLTGLNNRRGFEELFNLATYRKERYGADYSLILIDIDNFKRINDEEGHLMGDTHLKNLAELLKKTLRPNDIIVRWGGDEFAVLLEFEIDKAEIAGNRILTESTLNYELPLSLGLTDYRNGESLEELISRADRALYQAKKNGKNCLFRISS